jgi:catechol 2,3-dioxygenase-like lactoylglutathione lyase family enzyme
MRATPQEVTGGAHLSGIHIGLWEHATAEQHRNLVGIDFVVFRLSAVDGFHAGGQIRHLIMDAGRDQLIAFMGARGVPGVPQEYDTGINRGLGLPSAFYHVAFEAGSDAALEQKRQALIAHGVPVTPVRDHEWSKSIYFKDPNGIQLEFCCLTQDLTEEDAQLKVRIKASVKALGLEDLGGTQRG